MLSQFKQDSSQGFGSTQQQNQPSLNFNNCDLDLTPSLEPAQPLSYHQPQTQIADVKFTPLNYFQTEDNNIGKINPALRQLST